MSRTLLALILVLGSASAQEKAVPVKGQRVLSAGHSFHVFMPGILKDVAKGAEIADHVQVDLQSIGGSRVIQHWELADEKNKAKTALKTGKVDVFTLSPIYLPDDGIANFVQLGLEHNPEIRVTVQEFWLPYDVFDPTRKKVAASCVLNFARSAMPPETIAAAAAANVSRKKNLTRS